MDKVVVIQNYKNLKQFNESLFDYYFGGMNLSKYDYILLDNDNMLYLLTDPTGNLFIVEK
jgi:hypothetical protein